MPSRFDGWPRFGRLVQRPKRRRRHGGGERRGGTV